MVLVYGFLLGPIQDALYCRLNQDAPGTAKDKACVATPDSSAALYETPAGLTQLIVCEVVLAARMLGLGSVLQTSPIRDRTESDWQHVSHPMYYISRIKGSVVMRSRLNSPLRLGNEQEQEAPFRTLRAKGNLQHPSGTLALGYALNDQLPPLAVLALGRVDFTFEQGLNMALSYCLRSERKGMSLLGTLSSQWYPSTRHVSGVNAANGISPPLDGDIESKVPPASAAEEGFPTMMRIAAAYSFCPDSHPRSEINV